MSRARDIMNRFAQPHLGPAERLSAGTWAIILDMRDEDGRQPYTFIINSTAAAAHTLAWLARNPWPGFEAGHVANPEEYARCHVRGDGLVCIGGEIATDRVQDSPYELAWTIERLAYFVNAYAYFREHGWFPQPQDVI